MKKLIAILLLLFTTGQVHAQQSKATVISNIGSQINALQNNTSGAITPNILGNLLASMVNSYQQYPGVNPQTGTSYTVQLSDYGQLITFNNPSGVAVSLPQPLGNFAIFGFTASNIGSGNVTITPASSTIAGLISLTLSPGQSVTIWASLGNYVISGTGGGSGGGGSLTVGLTPISGGAANRLLYDNGGTLQEVTGANNSILTTGVSGILALTTSLPNGITATTQIGGDTSNQVATDAFVQNALTGAGLVTSVFGRAGAVTAHTGDYTFAQIGSTPTTLAGYGITNALVTTNNLSDLTNAGSARGNLGLGTFATQNYATPPAIGGTTPNAATFTTLTTNGTTNIITGPFQFNGNTLTLPSSAVIMAYQSGSWGVGHCLQVATGGAGGIADSGSACGTGGGGGGSTANSETFVANVNFTPGVTTVLPALSSLPASQAAVYVYEDGVAQPQPSAWSINLTTGVITFNAPIQALNTVYVTWLSTSISGGSVSTVSVTSGNGFAGTVANPTSTPAITLSTTVTGVLQGNGTAISAATTTGSGSVVLATSPTLITPTLGAATGTSLVLSGGGAITSTGPGGALASGAYTTAYVLPAATTSVLGGVIPDGTIITVNGSGNITVPKASNNLFGVARVDNSTITASSGVLTVPTATSSTVGLVEPDNSSISISSGVLSVIGSPATSLSVGTTTIAGGITGDCLYVTVTNKLGNQSCGSATSVTINSTSVSGATAGYFLYSDSSHVLQNLSLPAQSIVWTVSETFNGGLLTKRRTITTGASDTVLTGDYLIAYNKASTTAESLFACASGIDGQIYVFKDEGGNAATYPITITPSGGTIEGALNAVINSGYASVTFQCDASNTNWVAE
jgi:hypothetical protein